MIIGALVGILQTMTKFMLIVLGLFVFNTVSTTSAMVRQPDILGEVRRLQPSLTLREANNVVSAIASASSTCVVPWNVLLAMGFIESGLHVGSMNLGTKDYGLFQINEHTAYSLHLDLSRLLMDESYNAEAACRVLRAHKTAYGKFPYWLGTYQAGTHLKNSHVRDLARAYDSRVRRLAKDLYENSGVYVDGGS